MNGSGSCSIVRTSVVRLRGRRRTGGSTKTSGSNGRGTIAFAGSAVNLIVTQFVAVMADSVPGGGWAVRGARGAICPVGVVAVAGAGRARALFTALLKRAEFKVEGVDFFVEVSRRAVVGSCRDGSVGSWGSGLDRHGRKRDTFGLNSEAFQLNGVLKSFVKANGLELEELITECRTEVGDEEIEGHVVEG